MSAEARRRMGTDLAPLDLAWQAWHSQHLSLELRGRRGTFGTSIDVSGSLATNGDWRRWIFRGLDLRGRRGTFGTAIDVSGSSATHGDRLPETPRSSFLRSQFGKPLLGSKTGFPNWLPGFQEAAS